VAPLFLDAKSFRDLKLFINADVDSLLSFDSDLTVELSFKPIIFFNKLDIKYK